MLASLTLSCASTVHKFPLSEPLWQDDDRRPFRNEPEEYFSPFAWDGADMTLFRPLARFFAVDPAGESVNVNAMDEVPNSSWFHNRIGLHPVSPAELAIGPCKPGETDPVPPWTVKDAKPNGANPGFIIKDAKGKRFLVKFDGITQGPRASAADVMVSKLYWAAGYTVPCNQVVFFDRGILSLDPEATAETDTGDEVPLTERHLDAVFNMAIRLPDGRYRASTSLFLEGKPIGPFTYQGTRADDPNDVIPHEDRRELRGARVLAAWTNHFDSREQNTLAMWRETGKGSGYVEHDIIDFGDCLGSIWEPPLLGRRIGHAYYLDLSYVAADFLTLGTISRPWDDLRFGPSGRVFAYYDVASFDPEGWHPGYPNPAFLRMSERDAAWMARILSQFTDEHIAALAEIGRFRDPFLEKEIGRILRGRRDKILLRYLTRLSPLSHPVVERRSRGAVLCLRDLAVESGVAVPSSRLYIAKAWVGEHARLVGIVPPDAESPRVCVRLPETRGTRGAPEYLIVDMVAGNHATFTGPARVHLYAFGGHDYRVVGLERPEDHRAPHE